MYSFFTTYQFSSSIFWSRNGREDNSELCRTRCHFPQFIWHQIQIHKTLATKEASKRRKRPYNTLLNQILQSPYRREKQKYKNKLHTVYIRSRCKCRTDVQASAPTVSRWKFHVIKGTHDCPPHAFFLVVSPGRFWKNNHETTTRNKQRCTEIGELGKHNIQSGF